MALEPPADAGHHRVRQPPRLLDDLRPRFLADHLLQFAHKPGIGMGAGAGPQQVVGVVRMGDPVADGGIHRILQGGAAVPHRTHLGAQHLHARHVGRLARHVDGAHVDHAFQAVQRAHRGRGDPVLPRAGLGDDAALAHAPGQQRLTQAIVDLVGARVVQVFAFEEQAGAAQLVADRRGIQQRARAAHVVRQHGAVLGPEPRFRPDGAISAFKRVQRRRQRLGHVAAAVAAELPRRVGKFWM